MNVAIADGHDNVGGLTEWHLLSPPLFHEYAGDEVVYSEWHGFESRLWSGDRTYVPVGRQWVRWRFFVLSREEYAYIRATFSAAVTIRTLDKDGNDYVNFNANLVLPDTSELEWDREGRMGWFDVPVDLMDLEEIV